MIEMLMKRIEQLLSPGSSLVLKFREGKVGEDGKLTFKGEKFKTVTDLKAISGKYGLFLSNTSSIPGEVDTYVVSNTVKIPESAKDPVAKLRVKKAGAEEGDVGDFLCGLFSASYDDGTSYLRGTDKENMIEYRVYINQSARTQQASTAANNDLASSEAAAAATTTEDTSDWNENAGVYI